MFHQNCYYRADRARDRLNIELRMRRQEQERNSQQRNNNSLSVQTEPFTYTNFQEVDISVRENANTWPIYELEPEQVPIGQAEQNRVPLSQDTIPVFVLPVPSNYNNNNVPSAGDTVIPIHLGPDDNGYSDQHDPPPTYDSLFDCDGQELSRK